MGQKERIASLKRASWAGDPPIILTVKEAYYVRSVGKLYLITWSEDQPTGLTFFEFNPIAMPAIGQYPALLFIQHYEPRHAVLDAAELVLAFSGEGGFEGG